MLDAPVSGTTEECDVPQLIVAMRGQNMVIRSTAAIDAGCTLALVGAINSAAATGTVVVIDPEPVRCDDIFAGDEHATSPSTCTSHGRCEPVEAEAVNGTMIRIAAEVDSWTIDLRAGRFCQAAPGVHHLYVGPDAWVAIVAIIVTRTRLCALTTDGALITSSRAHRAVETSAPAVRTA
jgi:hypothetical protein